MPDGATTAHLYRPKLVTTLSEGYRLAHFRRDAAAGLTVAVVALPLSMAIAVASGVSPDRGLYTAIIGGAVVSALSGSRYQIGGPAGAFIVLVAGAVARFGLDGLITAVLMSGVLLTLLGVLRVGSLVKHVPHAVTVGFTCAIAVTILASQLKDLAGLHLDAEPGALIPKLLALGEALPSFNLMAFGVGLMVAVIILGMRRWLPRWPGMLIAVGVASTAVALLGLQVETVASRFGHVAHTLPAPGLPRLGWARMIELLPIALSFTLLGAVESLLSAKVADSMSGRRHRSNMELVAQGIANIASGLFGGICVTGTIARTATNIRAGAVSPVSGLLHSAFVLAFMLIAAPLAGYVPLSALAGVLVVVAWNMAETWEFARLLRDWRTAAILLTTFGLTVVRDLTTGILAGCLLAGLFALMHHGVAEEGD